MEAIPRFAADPSIAAPILPSFNAAGKAAGVMIEAATPTAAEKVAPQLSDESGILTAQLPEYW